MSRVEDLVHNISLRCDYFEAFWEAERKWHSNELGHISIHGVFSVLSEFVASNFEQIPDNQQQDLWEWIDWQHSSSEKDRTEAVVTCFLENIADTEAERYCRPFLSENLAHWFDEHCHRGRRKKRWFEQ